MCTDAQWNDGNVRVKTGKMCTQGCHEWQIVATCHRRPGDVSYMCGNQLSLSCFQPLEPKILHLVYLVVTIQLSLVTTGINVVSGDMTCIINITTYTCSTSYSLNPKYQVWHIKSTYYTGLGLIGDGPKAINCYLRIFLSDLVIKCPEVRYKDSLMYIL